MKKYFLFLAAVLLMLVGISALAESPTIPVVSLDGDCLIDYTNWNDKSTYYPATLTFTDGDNSFTKDIEIKPQGTTSLYAPKKNFTIKFSESVEMVDAWGTQKKYVLKADYIDPTHVGNVGSAKLAAEMNQKYGLMLDTPNYGIIDGFPVWVKINGEDAGIFNWTIPKDAWLFNMDEDNPNHLVLACEGWSSASKMQSAEIDYEADWVFEVGEATDENKAAFERMVEFVSTADDATFVRDFGQYLDLDACLNYLCFTNIAYGSDNVAKNMLMVTYDGKIWYPMLYDLDSLWGIGYDGTALAKVNGQWSNDLLTDRNCLLYRVNHLFGDQVRERYWELREGILSKEHIMDSFEAYAAQIPQEYYAVDHALWNADDSRIRTLDLMSQLMDEYLPTVDAHFMTTNEASPSVEDFGGILSAIGYGPEIHYVFGTDGILKQSENMEVLPVAMTLSYRLNGEDISAQELVGKSGQLEIVLRVERKVQAEYIYGIATLLHLEKSQCKNFTVVGGIHRDMAQEYVCMGSAWLDGTNTIYEMQLHMDVTEFTPEKYMVVASPVYVGGGGDDNSLAALLAVAGELMTVIDEGISLYDVLVELHGYLTNIQNGLTAISTSVQGLLPAEGKNQQDDALTIMQKLLADAEQDADALLTEFGYKVAVNATSADRVRMLSKAEVDTERTTAEKEQASALYDLIKKYLVIVGQLESTQQTLEEIDETLTLVTTNLPDLVGAYSYANDRLYAIMYKISTLYQNLANYYYSYNGNPYHGDGDAFAGGEWQEVIIFSNYEGIIAP